VQYTCTWQGLDTIYAVVPWQSLGGHAPLLDTESFGGVHRRMGFAANFEALVGSIGSAVPGLDPRRIVTGGFPSGDGRKAVRASDDVAPSRPPGRRARFCNDVAAEPSGCNGAGALTVGFVTTLAKVVVVVT
jgi:hypothetical protein